MMEGRYIIDKDDERIKILYRGYTINVDMSGEYNNQVWVEDAEGYEYDMPLEHPTFAEVIELIDSDILLDPDHGKYLQKVEKLKNEIKKFK